jgi:hypothetical protein
MRLHYQFVMANERRSTYDYFMMVCGPIPFARSTVAPSGPVELIASDGALIDPAVQCAVKSARVRGDAAPADESPHDTQTR